MGTWSRWLNNTLQQAGARLRPSEQEERILRLADLLKKETEAGEPAKAATNTPVTTDTPTK
jgi:hypothetical protein